jgi:hypothetical protein
MRLGKTAAGIMLWMVAMCSVAWAQECPYTDPIEAVNFLKNARSGTMTDAECVLNAIESLSTDQPKGTIDVLIDHLDFRRPGCDDPHRGGFMSIWACNFIGLHPAAGVLRDMGKPALPALVAVISEENTSTAARSVAVETTIAVFSDTHGSYAAGVRFLLDEAASSKATEKATRLRLAAADGVAFCYGHKNECEDVLNAPECPDGDASTRELIAFLNDAHFSPGIDPGCTQSLIRRLGSAKTPEAIEALTKNLEFERTGCNEEELPFSMNCILIAKHPAALELWHIGKPALPTLVKMVGEDGLPTGARSVAIETIMEIFRDEGKVEGIRILLDEAARSSDSARAEWLRRAASDALPYC